MTQSPFQSTKQSVQWDFASLFDLEYLSNENPDQESNLKKRDRSFYRNLEKDQSLTPADLVNRSFVFRLWVDERRKSPEFPQPTHGEIISETLGVFRFLGFLVCVLVGGSFAWGSLNISGRDANVLVFWSLTIALPFIFTLFGFYFFLREGFPQLPGPPSILRIWLCRWLVNASGRSTNIFKRKIPQEQAIRLERIVGDIKRLGSGREHFFMSALVSLLHLLGIGLVVGILLAIASFRLFEDQGYGWKTHSQWLTESRVHSIVRNVSLPWAWYSEEGDGYPTKIHISETRISQNGASAGGNPATRETWNMFLLWSALIYGVFPRLALYVLGQLRLRRAFDRENFLRFDALWRRMTIPNVTIEPPVEDTSSETPSLNETSNRHEVTQGDVLALVPIELSTPQFISELRGSLRIHHLEFSSDHRLSSLPSERESLLKSIADSQNNHLVGALVVQELFMPPNQSIVRFLQKLRETVGTHLPIHVVVLQDPGAQNSAHHLAAWRSRLDAVGDPLLFIVPIMIQPEKPLISS